MPEPALEMELFNSSEVPLFFKSMSGQEEVSRLFEYQVVALSESQTIAADDLLGKAAWVSIDLDAEGNKRWFHGIVSAFGIDGREGRYHSYRLTLRPWAWLMTRSADIRIFQAMTAPDIIKQVFGEYTGTFVDELRGTYATRTYCVQYRETDFNFVSRLMEEEGIFYYWRHAADKHELVLADRPASHVATPGFETVDFLAEGTELAEWQGITAWHMRHEIQTGKVTLSDYNFETPATNLKSTTAAGTRVHDEHAHEVYDYPGLYGAKAAGDARAQIRLDEHSARFGRFSGEGNTPGLAAGAKFTLAGHVRDDQNAEYVVLSAQVDMQQAGYEAEGDTETLFLCRFTAKPAADPFRPPRITRKPSVAGPQTAVVVGNDGDEITTDEYGRIKVQFHWDRLGAKNADSSCWLRVASSWAGNGWGMFTLPRIGQEVVVAFLEGDPDQPLVVGSVYNATQKTPYVLPDNATVSTLKSRSSKEGSAALFNELRFEDKKGGEYVLLQSQKDRLEFVEDSLRSQIGIGDGDEIGNEHRTVKKNRLEKIGGEHHLQVEKVAKFKYGDAVHITVATDVLAQADGKLGLKTADAVAIDVGGAVSLKAADKLQVKIGADAGIVSDGNVHLKGATNVVIEAGAEITLKAGGAFITIGGSGVTIKGSMVMINSGGAAGSGGGASPTAPDAPEAPTDPDLPVDPLASGHR